jgi:diguanylate cyclase (GGDEF)-like protein
MPLQDTQVSDNGHSGRLRGRVLRQTSLRTVLPLDRKHRLAETGLEENLSSALQAADGELAQLLRELEAISKVLKSDHPDPQTLRAAVHPAVWCAVKQALLDREMRCLALTDDLTCLYNRRGFFAAAAQMLKLARRNAQGLLLLFCDLDGLKKINDAFGHREGDYALVRVADALEQAFRASDILARLGGDEFVILALEQSGQTHEVILQRLKESLKKRNAGESRYELSLSVGLARFDPKRPISLGELMAKADQAMYEQKRITKDLRAEVSHR